MKRVVLLLIVALPLNGCAFVPVRTITNGIKTGSVALIATAVVLGVVAGVKKARADKRRKAAEATDPATELDVEENWKRARVKGWGR